MHVRVYNYNTLERVHQFEAHSDYLRAIAVHPSQPYILTSSGKIKELFSYDNCVHRIVLTKKPQIHHEQIYKGIILKFLVRYR